MKRQLTLLTLVFTCISLWADPVGRDQARESARLFLQDKGISMNTLSPVHRAPRKGATEQDNSYYYVFNAGNDQGYVIVSGDDRTEEILGYVDHGTYSEQTLPAHMKAWLQGYADQIQFLCDHNIQGSTSTQRAAARRRLKSTKHAIPQLLTTTWNQGYPYNSKCPVYYKGDGTTDQPASGCVATALAQVMNYYQYPKSTRKDIPAISNTYTLDNGTTKTVTTKAIRRYTKLDWDNMVDNYTGDETQEQKDAVGNLMYYIGQAVGMGYGSSSGASFGENVSYAFSYYFGYDDSAYPAYRSNYTIDEWFDLIYNEIDAGHPVGFAGWSTGGGHSFVLDGFDGESLFHLNWGWGGGSDGWFLLGVLNPGDNSGIGASTSSDGYSLGQTALMNVRMPNNVKAEPTACLTINNISIKGTSIEGAYINWTSASSTFNAAIVYQQEDGTLAPIGGNYDTFSLDPNYMYTKTYSVDGKLPVGTWKISPASKLSSAQVWHTAYNMRDTYIEAQVQDDGSTTLQLVRPNYNISVDEVTCVGTGEAGVQQEVRVRFTNHGDEYLRELRLFASTSDVKVNVDSRTMVALKQNESGTYSFYYTPSEAGIHNLWFCTDDKGEDEAGRGQITIQPQGQGTQFNLSAVSFSFKNFVSGIIYGRRLNGTLTVRNKDTKPFNGTIQLQLWRQPKGSSTAWSSTTISKAVEIAPEKTTKLDFEYPNLEYGPTYRIQVKVNNEEISNGGLWDHGWECVQGIVTWKNDGTIGAMAGKAAITTPNTVCAILIDNIKVTRALPNKNPNTIYAVTEDTNIPTKLEGVNLVTADTASIINITSGSPYCVPYTFTAREANFRHTFPESANGTAWQVISLPFNPDSLTIDSNKVALNDEMGHFWIYEYAWTGDQGEPLFAPASHLRAHTPYLIAADESLAGKTVCFTAHDVSMFQSGLDKAVVSGEGYALRGTTLIEKKSDVYMLNNIGTAFDMVDTAQETTPTGAYFTTTLDATTRLTSIALPEVPRSLDTPVKSIQQDTPDLDNALYNITGQRVGTIRDLQRGTLPQGIYVSHKRAILVK